MHISAYYDYYTDQIRPLKLVVRPDPEELDWTQTIYLPVDGPFERLEPEDYGDMLCVSVLLPDITLGTSRGQIGINLPAIADRHGTDAELFILLMDDVEEVMKLSL
ncbi:hypothetical protein M5X00_32025 [Paenibacillus alvei]|uniref:Uncharacterized protein n=1 Tax=Paenibacillus alvei TaxID=44250 RepID=A0ABT4GWY9_PAEAL|nr:hypothetical protein [Paenibacillus alvei]MCY9734680.1 hypothetical protein [Paenibacillus alvei]MCY9758846.1 hypothetical protein [Paenibacillus alvei]MCY9761195.1 hypothetical protein [Paenibacillus alvei]MCY9765761.1 hypothetical protein [Paenibacillus alvei]NEZ40313.1 hypothetical protein [Paenibacillus alvei]